MFSINSPRNCSWAHRGFRCLSPAIGGGLYGTRHPPDSEKNPYNPTCPQPHCNDLCASVMRMSWRKVILGVPIADLSAGERSSFCWRLLNIGMLFDSMPACSAALLSVVLSATEGLRHLRVGVNPRYWDSEKKRIPHHHGEGFLLSND